MIARALACLAGLAMVLGLEVNAVAQRQQPDRRSPGQLVPVEKNPGLMALLPDLVITSASVTPKCDGGTWTANINATVKNQSSHGTADLSKVVWQIVLAADWWFTAGQVFLENPPTKPVNPQAGGPMALKPGESWTRMLSITGIPKANVPKAQKAGHPTAQFGFGVTADPTNGVAEANENNNKKLIYLPMTTCSQP